MCPDSYLTIHGHARKGCTTQTQSLHKEKPISFKVTAAFRNTGGFAVVFFFSQGQPEEAAVPIKMFLIWCAKSMLELTLRLHLHQQCDIAYTNLILPCLGDESNL